MELTVRQLAKLAGVSNRTLHYYDQIGLLRPERHKQNGYRRYGEDSVLRLQQILFYRELGLTLEQIGAILDSPDFDLLAALDAHRAALQQRVVRLERLIHTVEQTILHLQGEIHMTAQDFYSGFDEEQQKMYAEEAEKVWGVTVRETQQRWNGYSREQKNAVLAQMHEISGGIAVNMEKGAESAEVQAWVEKWHRHINEYFYPCSLEVFESLGHMYPADPAFRTTYEKIRPGLAEFMEQAMTVYCRKAASG